MIKINLSRVSVPEGKHYYHAKTGPLTHSKRGRITVVFELLWYFREKLTQNPYDRRR